MNTRTIEDRLREEYFDLLPEIRKTVEEIETRVRHTLIPVSRRLARHEKVIVAGRVKSCESAIDKLRRQQRDSETLDPERADGYSFRVLKDLAGVRVMV